MQCTLFGLRLKLIISISMIVGLASGFIVFCTFLLPLEVAWDLHSCAEPKCNTTLSSPLRQVNCKCDNDCALYGDCCLDYTANSTSRPSALHELLECQKVHTSGVLMVSRCPIPSELNIRCTNQSLFLPVTDSNFTFRNIYCALCNNVSRDVVVPWQPHFFCGVEVNVPSIRTFESLENACRALGPVIFSKNSTLRTCIPHISTCSPRVINVDLAHNCTSGPYDLVTGHLPPVAAVFRNRYCAQCNGADADDIHCLTHFNLTMNSPSSTTGLQTGLTTKLMINVTWNNFLNIRTIISITPVQAPLKIRIPKSLCRGCAGAFQCYCNSQCNLHRDCCNIHQTPMISNPSHVYNMQNCLLAIFDECDTNYYKRHYVMVDSCQQQWITSIQNKQIVEQIAEKCNSSSLFPHSDPSTNLTFRNMYCAQCNNISKDQLVPWLPIYSCNVTNGTNISDIADVIRLCQLLKFKPVLHRTARSCSGHSNIISTCPSTFNGSTTTIKQCTTGAFGLVTAGDGEILRNKYCAECNGFDDFMCYKIRIGSCGGSETPPDFQFTSFLDVTGTGSVPYTVQYTVKVYCKDDEVYIPTIKRCRKKYVFTTAPMPTSHEPPKGPPKGPPKEPPKEPNVTNCSTTSIECTTLQVNETELGNDETLPITVTINCTAPIALNSSEYEPVDNNTILYQRMTVNIITHDHLGRPVICTNFTNSGEEQKNKTLTKPPIAYVVLTYIGASMSILGSLAILLTYSIFKELRSLPTKILMNLAATFLASDLLILLTGVDAITTFPLPLTTTMAILLHFFMLGRFSWMSLMAFESCRVLSLAAKLQQNISEWSKTVLLLIYLLIGWGLPLTITVITIIVNFTTDGLVLYGETSNGSVGKPWINHPNSLAVAFVAPVALSLLFNVAAFITLGVMLCRQVTSDKSRDGKLKIEENLRYFRVIVALFTAMGLTWLFGFLALISQLSWAWYPFIILNTTQTLWIAAAFLLTKKTGNLYLSKITCGNKRKMNATNKILLCKDNIRGK